MVHVCRFGGEPGHIPGNYGYVHALIIPWDQVSYTCVKMGACHKTYIELGFLELEGESKQPPVLQVKHHQVNLTLKTSL